MTSNQVQISMSYNLHVGTASRKPDCTLALDSERSLEESRTFDTSCNL